MEETDETEPSTASTDATPTPTSTAPPTEATTPHSTSAYITPGLEDMNLKPLTAAELGISNVKSNNGEVDQHTYFSLSPEPLRNTGLTTPDSLGAFSGALTEDSPQHSCTHRSMWFSDAHVAMETRREQVNVWRESQRGEMEAASEGDCQMGEIVVEMGYDITQEGTNGSQNFPDEALWLINEAVSAINAAASVISALCSRRSPAKQPGGQE